MDPAFYTSIDLQPTHIISGLNHPNTNSETPEVQLHHGNDDPTCVVGVTDLAEDFLESSNVSQISSQMIKGSSNNTLAKASQDQFVKNENGGSAQTQKVAVEGRFIKSLKVPINHQSIGPHHSSPNKFETEKPSI